MKKFLQKVIVYISVLSFLVVLIIFFFRKDYQINFVSNSVAQNMKAAFIVKNYQRFNNSRIIVIGSSMSLNNIDAIQIEDSFKTPTFNLASWGMKLEDFKDYDIWRRGNTIILNMHFSDFGKSEIVKKRGFPFTNSSILQFYNTAFDFKTYLGQAEEAKVAVDSTSIKSYKWLKFDSSGSAMFSDSNFNKSANRWNKDPFLFYGINDTKLQEFVTTLQEVKKLKNTGFNFIISFSPGRRIFYTEQRMKTVEKLAELIHAHCSDILFINKYDFNMPDTFFVDNTHFNRTGAETYTREIIESIKADTRIKTYK